MLCTMKHEVKVMKSQAGYYIGTDEDGMPFCRISVRYYPTQEAAENVLRHFAFEERHCVENEFCNKGKGCLS